MQKSRWIILSLMVLVTSCSQIRTRDQIEKEKQQEKERIAKEAEAALQGSDEDQKPPVPEAAVEAVVTPPVPIKLPKVGVVLGAGGAKAFAHAGVLKALDSMQIPVDYVVGLEWGSLVAALYANEGSVHDLQWKIYKMNASVLPEKSFLAASFTSKNINESVNQLAEAKLLEKQIDQFKIPFACPSISQSSGAVKWRNKGSFKDALIECFTSAPLFSNPSGWVAASFAVSASVEYLKMQGCELVIVVDLLSDTTDFLPKKDVDHHLLANHNWHLTKFLSQQMDTVNGVQVRRLMLRTGRYPINDFENRKSLVKLGQGEGKDFAQKIADQFGF